jgi:hypothetical protein
VHIFAHLALTAVRRVVQFSLLILPGKIEALKERYSSIATIQIGMFELRIKLLLELVEGIDDTRSFLVLLDKEYLITT